MTQYQHYCNNNNQQEDNDQQQDNDQQDNDQQDQELDYNEMPIDSSDDEQELFDDNQFTFRFDNEDIEQLATFFRNIEEFDSNRRQTLMSN